MKTRKALLVLSFLLCLLLSFSCIGEAAWKKEKSGKTRYYTDKTEYYKDGWYKISKKWYYFDEKGYLLTGRFKVDKKYYYVRKSSGKAVNKLIKGYYYGKDGAMVKNTWKKIGKYYFYFGIRGKMVTGRFTVENKTYYCSSKTGRAVSKRVGDYYYNSKGEMVRNRWVKKFYYGKDGKVKTGKFKAADGNTYYCDKKLGKLTSQWKNKNYYDEDGVMATNCWIGDSYVDETGTITKGNKNPVTEADIRLLAAITYLEAGNQSYYGKKCVASVVMNRVNSKKFPNTIKGVVYQCGQFTPAMNGSLTTLVSSGKTIQAECVKAAKYVLEKGSVLKGYYYFNNFGPGLQIGDHYFS